MNNIETIVIDITTNAINTGATAVTGSRNDFSCSVPTISLPQSTTYNLVVSDFRYPTVDLSEDVWNTYFRGQLRPDGTQYPIGEWSPTNPVQGTADDIALQRKCQSIVPLVVSDIADNIRVNGRFGQLIYKSLFGSSRGESQTYHVDAISDSPTFPVKINQQTITNIRLQIIRSDNGEPYPFDSSPSTPEIGIIFVLQAIDPSTGADISDPNTGAYRSN